MCSTTNWMTFAWAWLRDTINAFNGNIVLIDTRYEGGLVELCFSVLGFGSPGIRHSSVWNVHVLPVPVGSLWILFFLPQSKDGHLGEGWTDDSKFPSGVNVGVSPAMSWWLVEGCTPPPKAAGRDGRRWRNEITRHSNVSPAARATMRNAPARLHCATSCWLAEWHCCLGIELLWPPGTWHWSTTLIGIGN